MDYTVESFVSGLDERTRMATNRFINDCKSVGVTIKYIGYTNSTVMYTDQGVSFLIHKDLPHGAKFAQKLETSAAIVLARVKELQSKEVRIYIDLDPFIIGIAIVPVK